VVDDVWDCDAPDEKAEEPLVAMPARYVKREPTVNDARYVVRSLG
jgi:hypothetical protein